MCYCESVAGFPLFLGRRVLKKNILVVTIVSALVGIILGLLIYTPTQKPATQVPLDDVVLMVACLSFDKCQVPAHAIKADGYEFGVIHIRDRDGERLH